jgi:hypothetical protein
MRGVRKMSLRPYHGEVWLCDSIENMARAYKIKTRQSWPYATDPNGGRFVMLEGDKLVDRVFLVYGASPAALAHEFAHVLLIVFRTIGHDPREGDGEAFCYMLSQLMIESTP